jgi:HK97 family phage portal protein
VTWFLNDDDRKIVNGKESSTRASGEQSTRRQKIQPQMGQAAWPATEMKLFGLEINFRKKVYLPQATTEYGRGGWYPFVHEPYTGAWQRNDELYRADSVLSNVIVFRCVALIAGDIAKMRIRLVQQDVNGIWTEVLDASPLWPVLRKPNVYQNRIQFFEHWVTSKLIWGNTYVLKKRDNRNVVTELYVLDPCYVRPMTAPDGEIFYELRADYLSDVAENATVPASEIIHDRMNALYHPLCGLSPIYAAGLPAIQAQRIQTHSEKFFANGANPGGMITAPGSIPKEAAIRLKEEFQQKYSGANVGRTFVAGDGLKYEAFKVNAVDAQLIEQLRWTSETICAAFGVPGYKVGVGPVPSYNNLESLERGYYNDCLQVLIESIELCLDEGLELPKPYGTEFDLDDLLRMDTATLVDTVGKGVGAGVMKPNEARKRLNYTPVEGGDTPYLQQQNYSLAALNKRDTQADPFAPPKPPAIEPPPAEPPDGTKLLRDAVLARRYARSVAGAGHR